MKQPSYPAIIAKYNRIIQILGEDKIEQLYALLGSEKFSIARLRNIIKRKKIVNSIKAGEPCQKIISRIGGSRATVYRYMKNGSRKKVSD